MTVSYIGNGFYTGLSSDTKPTGTAIGARILETDTGSEFYWNGSAWIYLASRSRIDFSLPFGSTAVTFGTVKYQSITSLFQATTESLVQMTYPFAFTVTRMITKFSSNTFNGNSIVSFRDDAADVTGTAITITAGSTAEVDSGPLSVAVAAGSKINFKIDVTGSSSGAYVISHAYVMAELSL